MKFHSLLVSAALFTSSASAASYDYSLNGDDACVLINVAMDKSGSMQTEQTWMRENSIPAMVAKLQGAEYGYDHIFVCSHQFGRDAQAPPGAHGFETLGCSDGFDAGILGWTASTDVEVEDGYHAIEEAIANVDAVIGGIDLAATCGTMDRNMILVTDEDRDTVAEDITVQTVRDEIAAAGYILNLVVNVLIGNLGENNIGARFDYDINDVAALSPPYFAPPYFKFTEDYDNEVFAPDGSGGWVVLPPDVDASVPFEARPFQNYKDQAPAQLVTSLEGQSAEQYIALVENTRGAIWAIGILEKGIDEADANLSNSFSNAFIDIKVDEIACPDPPCRETELGGDPHITTWVGEHFEYHGQCDLVMAKDEQFAEGLGLDVHIRTKIVRFWSYIKTVAIRIGNDVLEIEGSPDAEDEQSHYWINYEYQGELTEFAGFPVTITAPSTYKRIYEIDLSSKFPKEKIAIHIYKEFVRVKFNGGKNAFGKTVGLLGDFSTGKTLARDGSTVLDDFTELGNEWQVLPAEPKLFHEVSRPQFPEKCLEPEDPRGERRRRLNEGTVTEEQAEAACASLNDALAQKDCVYDILATQDVGMVGAF